VLALGVMAAIAAVVYQLLLPYLPWALGGAVLLFWARLFLLGSRRHW
jgi:hypothetical protein